MSKVKIEPRSQEQALAAVENLLAFLLDHPDDYRWADFGDGYYISIPTVNITRDSGLITPPKSKIIGMNQ